MLDFNLTLKTAKIILHPLVPGDYDLFVKIAGDKSLWTYFTCDLSVKSELKGWVATAVNDMKNKTRLAFTIVDIATNNTIGSTSFGNISYKDKRIEIGWTWICKPYQGTGVNNQIKYLMIKHAFEVLNFERVEFKTDVLNMPARKSFQRIGAQEEGILRSHTLMTHNRRRDTIYYSILKDEWEGIKTRNGWK
ncbi:MAG TPA: GNAT family protein [Bacteroidales bacterium]|nr:GNAT family protein [Bacteroidales bacterium]